MRVLAKSLCVLGLGIGLILVVNSSAVAGLVVEDFSLSSGPGISDDVKGEDGKGTQLAISDKIRQGLREYQVRPLDILQITVKGEQDFDMEHVWVYPEGLIKYPPLGDVRVVGLTVSQVENEIAKLLEDYLVNPKVTVSVKEYHSKLIFVLGAVVKPGSFDLPSEGKISLTKTISMAQGLTKAADPDRIKIIRTEEGKEKAITVGVSGLTERGKDTLLKPSDIIFVPETLSD